MCARNPEGKGHRTTPLDRKSAPRSAPLDTAAQAAPWQGVAVRRYLVAMAVFCGSCSKVPLYDVDAYFEIADAAWFEEEETLFFFWDARAEQGLGDPSVLEVTWLTDDEEVDWTPIDELEAVHGHEEVDCGTNALCGSFSVRVPKEPRRVDIRLRYHRDGELALDGLATFNSVRTGSPWSHRSFLTYGVFDETNSRIQWRGRHVFPTIRNEQASELGLRRTFTIEEQGYGSEDPLARPNNHYLYGAECPDSYDDAGLDEVTTDERAVFDDQDLPVDAGDAAYVCAQSTVVDGTGTFTTGTVAQKNPEVKAAFPRLNSPVREATQLRFFLAPCETTIDDDHEEMQRQRLGMENLPATCIDDWDRDGFVDTLTQAFSDAVEAARPAGDDMVLVVGLHQDEDGVSELVEQALLAVVPEERHKSTPRVAGAFVFDSDARGLEEDGLSSSTLWCPSTTVGISDTAIPDASLIYCAILPSNPDTELGPFSFNVLPILPSRSIYRDFVETYSVGLAGEVTSRSYLAPEFATTADHVDLGDFGVITFLNDELISSDLDDAFSYCTTDQTLPVVFRSPLMTNPDFVALAAKACASGQLPDEVCAYVGLGLLPVSYLPEWHGYFPEDTYELGMYWDFPFLLTLEYETYLAGSLSAFGASVPFGLAETGEQYLGSALWTVDEISMEEELTQCSRFCDHPTFDSAGVYNVLDPFRTTYAETCYVPDFPLPGDGGFPSDP